MNPTETQPAEAFFADLLIPLQQARLRRGLRFFERQPALQPASYWEPPISRNGGVTSVALADADGAGLLAALAAHWFAQGEGQLASLEAELEGLRQALQPDSAAQAERPAQPSYSAYPLF